MNGWQLFAVIGAPIVTGLFSYLIARNQNKTNLNKAKAENEVNMDEVSNRHVMSLLDQYSKTNNDLGNKVDKLQAKIETIEDEFSKFKKKSEQEKAFLEEKIETLTDENEELKEKVEVLKVENNELREIVGNRI